MDDPINFWSRVAESSPVVVLLLLGALVGGGRLGMQIVNALLQRLDTKDAKFERLHTETVQTMAANTAAVRDLTKTLERMEAQR